MAAEAVATHPREWGAGPICVLSKESPPDASFRSEEHFVPEGLGFPWTALPRGMGTCDRMNAEFSRYESEWLRQGPMGCFRPFFVAEGKDEPPAYYAPSKSRKSVWFTRRGDGRRVLSFGPEVKSDLPDDAGPGVLTIRVPRTQARPAWVSLALHKLALLTLWLCRGKMVFDEGFDPLRRFLLDPTKVSYRPYWQDMLEGAAPGVEMNFLVNLDGEIEGEHARFGLQSVHVHMRMHHMQYGLVLLGDHPSLPARMEWEPWRDPAEKPPETTPIRFAFEALKRV